MKKEHEDYVKAYPGAMDELCAKRAAVMPIVTDTIVYGPNEIFQKEKIVSVRNRTKRYLYDRLDK